MSSNPSGNDAPEGSSVPPSASPTTGTKKRPTAWIIVAGVAVVAAIGLGIWAVNVNSDLNDAQSELEAQTAATQSAEAQVAAQAEAANAAAAELEKISSDNQVYVVSNEDVAQAESDVAAAEQAATEASANVAAAQDEASKLRAELDLSSCRTRTGTSRAPAGEDLLPRFAGGDLGYSERRLRRRHL